jgi:hypothetical protein
MPYSFVFDYHASRAEFSTLARSAGAELSSLQIPASVGGTDLTINIARIGPVDAPRKVITMAGTHGVEAPVGAAIHRSLLREMPRVPPGTAVIFVHCVNPWGMAHGRRANAANVDLNRNAIFDDAERYGAPKRYEVVRDLLLTDHEVGYVSFWVRAALKIGRYGFGTVKQAVTGGQYVDPEGIFYGGATLQDEIAALGRYFKSELSGSERVVAIDIHSGLGRFGTDALILDAPRNSAAYAQVVELFPGENIQAEDPYTSISYRTKGSLSHLVANSFPSARTMYACHEFGTRDPITVLHALVVENFLAKQMGRDSGTETKRQKMLREVFCPDDTAWHDEVVVPRGRGVFEKALWAYG